MQWPFGGGVRERVAAFLLLIYRIEKGRDELQRAGLAMLAGHVDSLAFPRLSGLLAAGVTGNFILIAAQPGDLVHNPVVFKVMRFQPLSLACYLCVLSSG